MNDHIAILHLCGGCSCKEKREGLGEGKFYCSYAKEVFPNGIVTSDIDGTACYNKGVYKCIFDFNTFKSYKKQ
ncbi:MAG: hypothetical protein II947_07680 [Bacteroidaceae bacterium]|nr:hypothetical protein [Bacteroidaceae bacterium]